MKPTTTSINTDLQVTKDFLINKIAELENRLEDFTGRAITADEHLADRVDDLAYSKSAQAKSKISFVAFEITE